MSIRPITLFDTMSDQKRTLEPAEPGKVSMYVCGVTVYDLTHIGHARVFIFFDVVQRFLRHLGYDLTFVRNHTDVDDKIIKRAAEKGIDPLELSQHFIEALDEDMGQLGVAHADVEPKVSEHIDEIIAMVKSLIERGHAYAVEGDVYFRISSFEDYGKLSGRKLDDMEAGRSGRVEASDIKEHPFDFALWKGAEEGELGWESPWGFGRPGWHIECSAMSQRYLGDSFDIHGGGRDLIFPHHENEIAQSEAACGHAPFARNWMHVGMVNVAETNEDGERVERKMSKSLGNFWTTRDVLQGFHPEAIRYFMHTVLYRSPITYAVQQLEEAASRVEYLYTCLTRIDEALTRAGFDAADNAPPQTGLVAERKELIEGFMERFDEAMADDFNTPRALALLGELARAINDATQSKKKPRGDEPYTLFKLRELLTTAGNILGLLEREPQKALLELRDLKVKALELDAEHIESLIAQRKEARDTKDWARADAIRDELDALQVEIMDSTEGTTWRIK